MTQVPQEIIDLVGYQKVTNSQNLYQNLKITNFEQDYYLLLDFIDFHKDLFCENKNCKDILTNPLLQEVAIDSYESKQEKPEKIEALFVSMTSNDWSHNYKDKTDTKFILRIYEQYNGYGDMVVYSMKKLKDVSFCLNDFIIEKATEKYENNMYVYEFHLFKLPNNVMEYIVCGAHTHIQIEYYESVNLDLVKEDCHLKYNAYHLARELWSNTNREKGGFFHVKLNDDEHLVIGHLWNPSYYVNLKKRIYTYTYEINKEINLDETNIENKRCRIECKSYSGPFYLKCLYRCENGFIFENKYVDYNTLLNEQFGVDDVFFVKHNQDKQVKKYLHRVDDLDINRKERDEYQMTLNSEMGGCALGVVQEKKKEEIKLPKELYNMPIIAFNWLSNINNKKGFFMEFIDGSMIEIWKDDEDFVVDYYQNDILTKTIYRTSCPSKLQIYKKRNPGPYVTLCIGNITEKSPPVEKWMNYSYTNGLVYETYPAQMHCVVPENKKNEAMEIIKKHGFTVREH